MNRATLFESPLGPMLLVADGEILCGVYFLGQKHFPSTLPESACSRRGDVLDETADQLSAYFRGRLTVFALPLAVRATDFQHAVWDALLDIPYGETVTYGELARRIGRPRSARAVGATVGRNPLSVIVPCHRVLGASGSLTGYAGGLGRKQALLALERRGFVPRPADKG